MTAYVANIHLGDKPSLSSEDGASWFVDNLELKDDRQLFYSDFLKPGLDSLWGKTVKIKQGGKMESGIGAPSGTLYLPKKLKMEVSVNGAIPPRIYIKEPIELPIEKPIELSPQDVIRLDWDKDHQYLNEIFVSFGFNKPLNYKVTDGENFEEFDAGERSTPHGDVKDIVRVICLPDNGKFVFDSTWLQGIDSGEVIRLHASRRTTNTISNGKSSYMIFSNYEVTKTFRMTAPNTSH